MSITDTPRTELFFEVPLSLSEHFTRPNTFRTPIFGVSPLQSPAALLVRHKPTRRNIVIFQRGQLHFFKRAIEALAHASPLRKPLTQCSLEELLFSADWARDWETNGSQGIAWILEAALGAVTGKVAEAREIARNVCPEPKIEHVLSATETSMVVDIVECVTAFVIGHEYGHIVADEMYTRIPFGDQTFAPILTAQGGEIEADAIGTNLSLRRNAKHKLGAENAYLGVMLFFSLLQFLEEFLRAHRDGGQDNSAGGFDFVTHPKLADRRKEADKVISTLNGRPIDTERGRAVLASFENLLRGFWMTVSPLALEWHRRGLSTHISPEYRLHDILPQPNSPKATVEVKA